MNRRENRWIVIWLFTLTIINILSSISARASILVNREVIEMLQGQITGLLDLVGTNLEIIVNIRNSLQ